MELVFSRAIVGQSRATFACSIIGLIYSQGWQLNVNKLSVVNAAEIAAKICEPIRKGRKFQKYHDRIGRLCDPRIGFEKDISAAEKTFKTLAFFSYFVLKRI